MKNTDTENIKAFVANRYPYLGKNKQQVVTRLLFEIAKRERIHYKKIAGALPPPPSRFTRIKGYLLQRRYPSLAQKGVKVSQTFCDINIDKNLRMDITKKPEIRPKYFFVEESVTGTEIVQRLKYQFANSNFITIKTYREELKNKQFSITDYNKRLECFYIIRESYDFYKQCPCSNNSVSCGYFVMNLGSGCPYECSYCFLQTYINSPGIIVPANIEDFFSIFKKLRQNMRFGSGELTDSLAFDHITQFSKKIVAFFRHYPKSIFEFKTKSNNTEVLTSVPGARNIIVSWSLNPQPIIDTVEYFTASLEQRLAAAQRVLCKGYRVAFHFDPIIYYSGWETDYESLVKMTFDKIDGENIAWISLGALRMKPQLKKIIENRFPENTILDEEFLTDYDGKLRYPAEVRTSIYKKMTSWIRKQDKNVPIYLCMEDKYTHRSQ